MGLPNVGLVIGFLLVGGLLLTTGFGLLSSPSPLSGWILISLGFGSFIAGIVSAKSAFG